MILQTLYEYYQRKSADPENTEMAPAGWQWKEIPFVVVLDKAGKLATIEDYRKEKNRARPFLVPQEVKRTVGVAANILWDKPSYIWGYAPEGKPDRLRQQQEAFLETVKCLPQDDEGVRAALKWLSNPKEALEQAQRMQAWPEIAEAGPFMALRLDGDADEDGGPRLVCQRPLVKAAIQKQTDEGQSASGICLITGEQGKIARLHAPIKGVPGAQTSGGAIVSFNQRSFCSYGKEQGDNAPVGQAAADAYTKALNHLLGKDSRQKIQCGGTTVVFWARRKEDKDTEESLANILGWQRDEGDNPDERTNAVLSLLQSPHKGGGANLSSDDRFFILGLSPNAARLSVRFWFPATVSSIKETLARWFKEIHLTGGKTEYPPLRSLLSSLALEYKLENLPPLLEGEALESIFKGTNFPQTLLPTALRRMRAEQSLPHLRAALIKAVLVRNYEREDIAMSLNPDNSDTAYQLGRLFAVLEKTQEDTGNSTIGERYFASASSRPVTVFPVLHRLNKHHQKKLMSEKPGWAINREKMMAEVMSHLSPPYPAVLSLEQQGSFAIGYYHQRQAFFTKAEKHETSEEQAA